MMTELSLKGCQIKAARSLTGITLRGLSDAVDVSANTICKLESQDGVNSRISTLSRIIAHFESLGVRFERGGCVFQTDQATTIE